MNAYRSINVNSSPALYACDTCAAVVNDPAKHNSCAQLEERVMRKHLATIADKTPTVDFDPTSWLAGLDQTGAPPPAADVPQFPREQWITCPNRRAIALTYCEAWLDKGLDPTDPTYLFLLTYGGRERIGWTDEDLGITVDLWLPPDPGPEPPRRPAKWDGRPFPGRCDHTEPDGTQCDNPSTQQKHALTCGYAPPKIVSYPPGQTPYGVSRDFFLGAPKISGGGR